VAWATRRSRPARRVPPPGTTSSWGSAATTGVTPHRCGSSPGLGSTTCPARHTGFPSLTSPRPRPSSGARRGLEVGRAERITVRGDGS
jgi:hypothetical protein